MFTIPAAIDGQLKKNWRIISILDPLQASSS